jgi:hypothetical protein
MMSLRLALNSLYVVTSKMEMIDEPHFAHLPRTFVETEEGDPGTPAITVSSLFSLARCYDATTRCPHERKARAMSIRRTVTSACADSQRHVAKEYSFGDQSYTDSIRKRAHPRFNRGASRRRHANGDFPQRAPGPPRPDRGHGRPRAPLITPPASLSMCAPLEQGPPRLKRP